MSEPTTTPTVKEIREARAKIHGSTISVTEADVEFIFNTPHYIDFLLAEVDRLKAENKKIVRLIDTPHTDDFIKAVPLEAAHQVKRWGVEHDVGKTPWDWFWLIGYLAQKAASAALSGNTEKAKHHTISTAAVLLNWFRRLTGEDESFQPGIDPTKRGAAVAAGEN